MAEIVAKPTQNRQESKATEPSLAGLRARCPASFGVAALPFGDRPASCHGRLGCVRSLQWRVTTPGVWALLCLFLQLFLGVGSDIKTLKSFLK